jgi:CRP-like cAMP-binding protein
MTLDALQAPVFIAPPKTVDSDLAARMSSIPLYANLNGEERADVAMGLRLLRFDQGDIIVRQGSKADGLYFILRGEVEVTIALPGGGALWVTDLTDGNLIGELAMIRSAPRNATVRAKSLVEAIFADWRFLTAALAQLRPGAFKVFRNISSVLAERMRSLHGKIHSVALRADRPYELLRVSPSKASGHTASLDFNVNAFLPVLPCFRDFSLQSIDAVRSRASMIEVERGKEIVKLNDPAELAYIVVRGAVASGFTALGGFHLASVRGPGCFCNVASMIDLSPASASFLACENAILLEMEIKQFREVIAGTDETAYAFLSAVVQDQANSLARTMNHFKRIAGLTRMISQFRAGSKGELSLDIA